jgi:hypothetical protein
MSGITPCRQLKSNAVILHLQLHTAVAKAQRHTRARGTGVAKAVAHGLASDLEKLGCLPGVQPVRGPGIDVKRESRGGNQSCKKQKAAVIDRRSDALPDSASAY